MSLSLNQVFKFSAFLALLNFAMHPAVADTQFKMQSDLGSEIKLPVHQWSDPDRPVKGIVVAVQALIFDGLAWNQLARHLNEKGYIVYAQDFRGYGQWLTEADSFGGDQAFHFGQSKDDLTKILTALRKKYPEQKIFCIGESLGANISIWEASTDPALMDGVLVCGLTNKHHPLKPKPHWAVTIVKGLNNRTRPINLRPYMNVLTEDKAITSAMLNDEETLTAISPTDLIKANITNKNALKEVENIPESMPIMIIAGAKDKVQITKSLDETFERMGSKHKELIVLPNKGHLLLEHQAVDPDIAQLIDKWMEKCQKEAKPIDSAEKPAPAQG